MSLCVLHVIVSLLHVPVSCPCLCTARDFAPAACPYSISLRQSVRAVHFCPCETPLFYVQNSNFQHTHRQGEIQDFRDQFRLRYSSHGSH